MSFRRGFVRLLPLALITAMSCRNPAADATMIEQMRQLGDELNASRQEAATMHDQIDSVRVVVARQDTLLRQLAEFSTMRNSPWFAPPPVR